ncbi:MAG: phage baseplate assembly protein V [Anaerolineae bacterium]
MSRIEGVVVGVVRSLDDPQNEGRIQVDFPWLPGKNRSFWAPVATLMAGGNRGAWFMPEPQDEVLVAFDHGDVNHPYIIGFLWNGQDKPPETDPNIRMLKTKKGHTIILDDKDDEEKIEIRSQSGHQFLLNDKSEKIEIRSKGGLHVLLDDASGGGKIELKGGQRSMVMSRGKVEFS